MGKNWRVFGSILLILLGVAILLSNLELLPWDITTLDWFWMVVFGGAGLAFLYVFVTNREQWWAIIPGLTLIGLAGLLTNLLPGDTGGAFFLGMIGISFWGIFLTHRKHWWAIIPGGTLVTLALVTLVSDPLGGMVGGAAFFFGLALTFLVVYLLPTPDGRMKWAIWPAGALGIMAALMTLGMSGVAKLVLPAGLIVVGGWLVWKTLKRQ